MDGRSVSPRKLYARLGSATAPMLLDVRREDSFGADGAMIIGAVRRPPESVARWQYVLPKNRDVVVYCVDGGETSQGIAGALQKGGVKAAYLDGGIAGWKVQNLPTRRKRDASDSKWVTREHPKIDRIACPWLISRFVNPEADFIYVAPADVAKVAADVGGTAYDIENVAFGHVNQRCSFDAIVRAYDIDDAALDRLASIVRGADTSRPDLAPQCDGLLAISHGLSTNFPDDHEMLKHGLVIYDALYAWCRQQTNSATRA